MGFADPRKWSDAAISVLVCDDGAIGRRQLTVALEASDHIEVVAEADGGELALAEAVEVDARRGVDGPRPAGAGRRAAHRLHRRAGAGRPVRGHVRS